MTDSFPRNVLVAGSGRSGTSWLGQMVQAAGPYISIFEPLHPGKVGKAGLLWGRYLRPKEEAPELEGYFGSILRGRGLNRWTDQENPGAGSLLHPGPLYRRLRRPPQVIKVIRANLMLEWLRCRFPVPMVFIVRHPLATIASWVKLGWGDRLNHYLSQRHLVEDHLSTAVDGLDLHDDPIAALAARWAIENLVPLSQMRAAGWVVCSYEDLLQRPYEEMERILDALGLCLTERVKAAIGRPSISTHSHSTTGSVEERLGRWRQEFEPRQVDAVLKVLDRFGVDLYDRGLMPTYSLSRWSTEGAR